MKAQGEYWRVHPGTGLEVSDLGRVANPGNDLAPRQVRAVRDVDGYPVFTYRERGQGRNGKTRTLIVARLVLETWVGPAPLGMVARPRDGDRGNVRLDNLAWAAPSGSWNPRPVEEAAPRPGAPRKLAWGQERQLRQELADGVPAAVLATRYDVSIATVYRYKARRRKA
jgi:hypothetical protein